MPTFSGMMPLLPLLLLACTDKDSPAPDDSAVESTPTGGDSDSAPPSAITLGAACDPTTRVGEVGIWTSGFDPELGGTVYDAPDPWIGPAELATETCAFHRFSTTSCGDCDDDETCSFAGICVPQRHARTDLELDVEVDGALQTFTADPITGMVYGPVGTIDASFTLTLRYAGQAIALPALTLARMPPDLRVVGEGDSMAPGAIDASWTPIAEGSRVRTVIPINHHAAGPTFTSCDAPGPLGSFHADAAMIQPLAVVTGVEFQGVDAANTAAVETPEGCLEIRLGERQYTSVEWEN